MSGSNLDLLKKSEKESCAISATGTGRNAVFCGSCLLRVLKKCSGIMGSIHQDAPDAWANAWLNDGKSMRKILVGVGKLGVDSQGSATLVTEVAASAGCCHMQRLSVWCKFR